MDESPSGSGSRSVSGSSRSPYFDPDTDSDPDPEFAASVIMRTAEYAAPPIDNHGPGTVQCVQAGWRLDAVRFRDRKNVR
jgi:hypothetical protein